MSPSPGTRVRAETAFGDTVTMVAVSGPTAGRDFPIVWVCTEDEFERATADGSEPERVAWPLSALEPA
jgi:hypothetical protein